MPRTPPRDRGCRFIPNRTGSHLNLAMAWPTGNDENGSPARGAAATDEVAAASGDPKDHPSQTYSMLLQSELLGIEAVPHSGSAEADFSSGGGSSAVDAAAEGSGHSGVLKRATHVSPGQNVLRFQQRSASAAAGIELADSRAAFSLSPVGTASLRLMSRPTKSKRKIAKVPFKVLDAPALQDDFYLNLVDWSSQNVLAVGLGSSVYLWSACTSKVTRLCDLGPEDTVTSVSWTQHGRNLSVGTGSGEVQIWDAQRCKAVRTMVGHTARVGTMAWNSQTLATGSRDRMIFLRDVRSDSSTVRKLPGHRQEVCGLKWSFDEQQLASGGNDNKLCIWDAGAASCVARFGDHTAAVKAIAWSPHQHGLLASGGGTADRKIRFWNTLTNAALNCVDTDSQVCNASAIFFMSVCLLCSFVDSSSSFLLFALFCLYSQVCNLTWSKNVNEIVSTHGYSLNQIIVWRYPSMTKVATLTGHTYRVLYLAMSPDGQTIVVSFLLCTVTFYANHAHNLTRSP
jgi:cell division cycle 20-like protein 1 (cofactor of APC complex)